MPTYFARHTKELAVDDACIELLWSERRFAVHYPEYKDGSRGKADNASTDPADHARIGAQVMRCLRELTTQGGYVCAQYRGHPEAVLGYVAPNTPIEPLTSTWREEPTRPAALKTVRLTKTRTVNPLEQAIILAGRPIRGTLTPWPSAGEHISALVEGTPLSVSLESLFPPQQEMMCTEFLRSGMSEAAGLPRLQTLLLPPGRTLKGIDILGVAVDGKRIAAQVTYSNRKDIDGKLAALRNFSGDGSAHLVMFCRGVKAHVENDVHLYALEDVFQQFRETGEGKLWLAHATGRSGEVSAE